MDGVVAPGAPVPADALVRAARRHGRPLYLTSVPALDVAAAELRGAFPDPWLRAYSLKANDVPAVVARLGAMGLDASVVSQRVPRVSRSTITARGGLGGRGGEHLRPTSVLMSRTVRASRTRSHSQRPST